LQQKRQHRRTREKQHQPLGTRSTRAEGPVRSAGGASGITRSVAVSTMSVKELRAKIDAAGLSHKDCVEKNELQDRCREAFVVLKDRHPQQQRSNPAQRNKARGVDGASGAGPAAARLLRQVISDQGGMGSTTNYSSTMTGGGSAKKGGAARQSKPTERNGPTTVKTNASAGGGLPPLPPLMVLCEMDRAQLLQECTSRGITAARGDSKGALVSRLRSS
jgi:hypothetical protein